MCASRGLRARRLAQPRADRGRCGLVARAQRTAACAWSTTRTRSWWACRTRRKRRAWRSISSRSVAGGSHAALWVRRCPMRMHGRRAAGRWRRTLHAKGQYSRALYGTGRAWAVWTPCLPGRNQPTLARTRRVLALAADPGGLRRAERPGQAARVRLDRRVRRLAAARLRAPGLFQGEFGRLLSVTTPHCSRAKFAARGGGGGRAPHAGAMHADGGGSAAAERGGVGRVWDVRCGAPPPSLAGVWPGVPPQRALERGGQRARPGRRGGGLGRRGQVLRLLVLVQVRAHLAS